MKKSTKDRVRMYDAVHSTLMAHQDVWSENQAFVAGVGRFNTLYEELKLTVQRKESITAGISAQRKVYLDQLIVSAMTLRDGLSVFALDTNDYAMQERLSYSKTGLKKSTQLDLRSHLASLSDMVQEHEDALIAYGVGTETILRFMELYDDFDKEIVSVRVGIIDRKFQTAKVDQLEKEIYVLFKKRLDVLARLLAVEHPDFFTAYKDARVIIDRKRNSFNPSPPEGESDVGMAS